MGGCATKPKVLKADDRSIPAPPPESVKEAVTAASEEKEGAEKGDQKAVDEDVKSKDVDEADKVDDEANTRQSLSNLLHEDITKTETVIETDNNSPSEPTKTEPVEQESHKEKEPTEPISTKESEPLSVEPEAAPEATATVDVAETEKNETSAAAVAGGEEGKSEIAK